MFVNLLPETLAQLEDSIQISTTLKDLPRGYRTLNVIGSCEFEEIRTISVFGSAL